jgi:FeS assembly SUF system regulator
MIRLSRLTDYGIVLMSHFAQMEPVQMLTARELAEKSGIPLPTVSKLLKLLSKSDLISSHRGTKGGYSLVRKAHEISVAEMIDVLEGPIAMTECSSHGNHFCGLELVCPTKNPWQRINHVVRQALSKLSLADMAGRFIVTQEERM